MSKLNIGDTAPDLTLVDTDRKMVKLSEINAKRTVLLFFPAAFTSTCTAELCEMRDNLNYYSSLNAQIIGISVDLPFTLNKFKEDNNYNFLLLSDFNKEASKAFGALYEDWILGLKGVSKRASFVLDENRKVIYMEILENAGEYPNMEGIKKAVEL